MSLQIVLCSSSIRVLLYIIRSKLRCHSLRKGKRGPLYSRSFPVIVCYTAVFSVVTQCSSDDTKNGCLADYPSKRPNKMRTDFMTGPALTGGCMAKKSGDINVLNKYFLSKMTICIVSCCPQLKFFAYSECVVHTSTTKIEIRPCVKQSLSRA